MSRRPRRDDKRRFARNVRMSQQQHRALTSLPKLEDGRATLMVSLVGAGPQGYVRLRQALLDAMPDAAVKRWRWMGPLTVVVSLPVEEGEWSQEEAMAMRERVSQIVAEVQP